MAGDTRTAYHWLRADMRSESGDEPTWTVGEERSIDGDLVLCERGYHYCLRLFAGLKYRSGPVACLVRVSGLGPAQSDKGVARTRRLLAAVNVEHELRSFTLHFADGMLNQERRSGREPDARSWHAVRVAHLIASGRAEDDRLAIAQASALQAWEEARESANALRSADEKTQSDVRHQIERHQRDATEGAAHGAYIAAGTDPGGAAWEINAVAGQFDSDAITDPCGWMYGGTYLDKLDRQRDAYFERTVTAVLLSAPRVDG